LIFSWVCAKLSIPVIVSCFGGTAACAPLFRALEHGLDEFDGCKYSGIMNQFLHLIEEGTHVSNLVLRRRLTWSDPMKQVSGGDSIITTMWMEEMGGKRCRLPIGVTTLYLIAISNFVELSCHSPSYVFSYIIIQMKSVYNSLTNTIKKLDVIFHGIIDSCHDRGFSNPPHPPTLQNLFTDNTVAFANDITTPLGQSSADGHLVNAFVLHHIESSHEHNSRPSIQQSWFIKSHDDKVAKIVRCFYNVDEADSNKVSTWWIRRCELEAYVKVHGNALVPGGYGPLATWVQNMRQEYASKRNKWLTDTRVSLLNELGFVWIVKKGWTRNYKDLQQYHEKYGHVNVPHKDLELGKWVKRQRYIYSQHLLSPLRIEMLEKLGFKWRAPQRWTEEECTHFDQNIIKHGWGNWQNMTISSRSSQQIKSHAEKVKKNHRELYERLIREHANMTADIRTYFPSH
jgi:hypothetical protein